MPGQTCQQRLPSADFMYGYADAEAVYYCPKCDRTVTRERLEEIDPELMERFGKSCLSSMRCPVCDTDFIDLDKVPEGGEGHAGGARRPLQG